MAIIIGAGTQVEFNGACVVSANWGYNPNTQRLYCIGEWSPRYSYSRPTETLSLSIYSGTGGPLYDVEPTQSCANANTLFARVIPAACGGSIATIEGNWFVTGYGFSKDDPLLPGQESWSMQRWIAGVGVPAPTYVLRGITEGSGTKNGVDADPGIVFTGVTTVSYTGSVSAGGIGRSDEITVGVVQRVGGSESPAAGKTGRGDASMPYTPLWI